MEIQTSGTTARALCSSLCEAVSSGQLITGTGIAADSFIESASSLERFTRSYSGGCYGFRGYQRVYQLPDWLPFDDCTRGMVADRTAENGKRGIQPGQAER